MDVDIDLSSREDIVKKIPNIPASIIKNNEIKKHNSGVYFQNIPTDPETGLASIDYEEAEKLGFIKIDFLNNHVYDGITSMDEMIRLENEEPNWSLLEKEDFVNKIPHLKGHFDIVKKIKPRNIHDLAIILALIRPGKRYLLNSSKKEISEKIWKKENENSFTFKKSHSYAYAKMIMIYINKISSSSE
ncbi:MAG: hypothetical protein QXF12_04325 [Candidatus Aenigmatarchaeota archaeon]